MTALGGRNKNLPPFFSDCWLGFPHPHLPLIGFFAPAPCPSTDSFGLLLENPFLDGNSTRSTVLVNGQFHFLI